MAQIGPVTVTVSNGHSASVTCSSARRIGTFVECDHRDKGRTCRGIDLAEVLHAPLRHIVGIEIDFPNDQSLALKSISDLASLSDELIVSIANAWSADLPEARVVFRTRPQDDLFNGGVRHGVVLSVVSRNSTVADAGGAAIPPAEGCA